MFSSFDNYIVNNQSIVCEFQALNTSRIKTKDKHTADNHLTTTNVSQNFAALFCKIVVVHGNELSKTTKKFLRYNYLVQKTNNTKVATNSSYYFKNDLINSYKTKKNH